MVAQDGAVVRLPQARQRGLLAVMMLHPNQVLGADRLISLIWGDDAQATGTGSLRTLIWSVRRSLMPDEPLKHALGGYRLEVRSGELDLEEFRQLARLGGLAFDSGDHDTAVRILSQALRLWAEPPLVDVPHTPAMLGAVHGLVEERRAAREALFTARLALGHHRDLLPDLEAETSAYPQSERSWECLMIARYRCGRRAEALDAYLQAREYLAANYGIDPGPCLQQLHRQILADDAALTVHVHWSGV
jgi:DNA-binding SARP family transcriptional activator